MGLAQEIEEKTGGEIIDIGVSINIQANPSREQVRKDILAIVDAGINGQTVEFIGGQDAEASISGLVR